MPLGRGKKVIYRNRSWSHLSSSIRLSEKPNQEARHACPILLFKMELLFSSNHMDPQSQNFFTVEAAIQTLKKIIPQSDMWRAGWALCPH